MDESGIYRIRRKRPKRQVGIRLCSGPRQSGNTPSIWGSLHPSNITPSRGSEAVHLLSLVFHSSTAPMPLETRIARRLPIPRASLTRSYRHTHSRPYSTTTSFTRITTHHLARPRLRATASPSLPVSSSPSLTMSHSSSSSAPQKPAPPPPRPSSSIVLLSPENNVVLLHRVRTSTSFASAHVFPGGNLDAFHDGAVPAEDSPERHEDGLAYRMAAVRECFEETGILLARRKDDDSRLVSLDVADRDAARKKIHGNKINFADWVESIGGIPDTGKPPPSSSSPPI